MKDAKLICNVNILIVQQKFKKIFIINFEKLL